MGKWLEAAKPVRAVMDAAGVMLTDEQAATVPTLYRPWKPGLAYNVGERRTFSGALYRCLQAHTAQENWTPTDVPSLWAKVLTSDTGAALPWEQPESTNPYQKGDKVTHNGQTWVSTINNNTWEPGVYGWAEA